jgi:hypothetical protein
LVCASCLWPWMCLLTPCEGLGYWAMVWSYLQGTLYYAA